MGKLICEICGKYETTKPCNLKRHHLACIKHATDGMFDDINEGAPCSYSNSSQLLPASSTSNFTCVICQRPHGNMTELKEHRSVHSTVPIGIPTAMNNDFASIQLAKHAFDGHVCDYDLMSHEPCSDVLHFFKMSEDLIKSLFRYMSPDYVLQGRMVARIRYHKVNEVGQPVEEVYLYFSSLPPNHVLDDGKEWYDSHSRRIIEIVDTMNHNSSNMVFDSIERVHVKLTLHDNNL